VEERRVKKLSESRKELYHHHCVIPKVNRNPCDVQGRPKGLEQYSSYTPGKAN
jgi:hypothetical protein